MMTIGVGFISGMMIGVEFLGRDFNDRLKFGVAVDLLIFRVLFLVHDNT